MGALCMGALCSRYITRIRTKLLLYDLPQLTAPIIFLVYSLSHYAIGCFVDYCPPGDQAERFTFSYNNDPLHSVLR
jgi:hypothetical protein